MDVTELSKAAVLAEELSRYRHKKLRLIVTPHGITVYGKLIRPDGVTMLEQNEDRDWAQIGGDAASIDTAIRQVDRALVFEWTHMEPADDH